MIIKPYVYRAESDPRLKAGVEAEKQMAHYLDRQFRDSKRFLVLHDLRFEHDGENAQIDHLIVHQYGVAIVESKSVSTTVRVNELDEWERYKDRRWAGMPNPLLQAERQGRLLKSLLRSREAELLDKVLGIKQGTFAHMAINVFAAISDNGRIERVHAGLASNALKADAVPAAIEKVVAEYRKADSLFSLDMKSVFTAPRDFNESEQMRVARFLDAADRALRRVEVDLEESTDETPPRTDVRAAATAESELAEGQAQGVVAVSHVACKYCGHAHLLPRRGPYGPYGQCLDCGKNTPVKVDCESCQQPVKLKRVGQDFAGQCEACGLAYRVSVRLGPLSNQ